VVGGDKSGQWERWYKSAIPLAGARYADHLATLDRYLQAEKPLF
jgi:hypothetical protein